VSTGLLPPHSVANMFGSWLQRISVDLRPFVLLVATTFCWSMWLCRNDMVFEKKTAATPLHVIYSVIHWLRTWTILQKATSQDLVAAACQRLAQVAKEFFTRTHGWQSSLRITSH
jgi:hypothetical protein